MRQTKKIKNIITVSINNRFFDIPIESLELRDNGARLPVIFLELSSEYESIISSRKNDIVFYNNGTEFLKGTCNGISCRMYEIDKYQKSVILDVSNITVSLSDIDYPILSCLGVKLINQISHEKYVYVTTPSDVEKLGPQPKAPKKKPVIDKMMRRSILIAMELLRSRWGKLLYYLDYIRRTIHHPVILRPFINHQELFSETPDDAPT
jgi:hypothetical protein